MTLVVACISVVNMVFFTLSLDEFIALQFHELPILNHSGLSLELLLLGTLISEQVMNAVELIVGGAIVILDTAAYIFGEAKVDAAKTDSQ